MTTYFADTYAIIEYLRGNRGYAPYIEKEAWATSLLNLIEMYYAVLRDNDEESAERAYSGFRRRAVEITDSDVAEGMKLRLGQKARKVDLSYTDAIGYAIAVRRGSSFLTGDKTFSGFQGVRFVT